jgi:ABC-type antimicrobial peptide transport system permease subunit
MLFPDREPIGGVFENGYGGTFHVIGVADDVRRAVAEEPPAWAYVLPDTDPGGLYIIVRVRERGAAVLSELKASLSSLTSRPPLMEWWADSIGEDNAYRDPRFQTIVLGTLAALALGLTGLGMFSVVAYLVAARTREMGVRLAIGSSPGALVRLVVRQTLAPVGVGLVAGLLLITWVSQLAQAQFVKVETHDPVIVAAAVVTVVLATLIAAYLPARRATRINPTDVLRAD